MEVLTSRETKHSGNNPRADNNVTLKKKTTNNAA
jgi:hypothetical protein